MVPTTATATEDAATQGAMTAARPNLSPRTAPGPIPSALVAAIAVNSAPRPAGVYPCSCMASSGSKVARPPAPLKKSAALRPLTAKKSLRDSSAIIRPPSVTDSFFRPTPPPVLLATPTSPVAASSNTSRSAWDPSSRTCSFEPPRDFRVSGTVRAACHPASAHVIPTATNGLLTPSSITPDISPPSAGPTAAPASTAAWLAPSTLARLAGVDASASSACAPAMYTALPAPAMNLQKNSSGRPVHAALPSMPTAVIRGPATINGLRPCRSAMTPHGTLSTSLAAANALRVMPTCAAVAPNSSANRGRTGATHEWPAMRSAVVTQMSATRLFSLRNPARFHTDERPSEGPSGAPILVLDDDDDAVSSRSLHTSRPDVDATDDEEKDLRASHLSPHVDSSPNRRRGCPTSTSHPDAGGLHGCHVSRRRSEYPTTAGVARRAEENLRRRVPTAARVAMAVASAEVPRLGVSEPVL